MHGGKGGAEEGGGGQGGEGALTQGLHMCEERGAMGTGDRLTCGASTQEGSPPPGMVLDCQLEVGEGNGDESCDNDKDDEDDEEDGVDGVHLVAPHAGKDVVQLNVDGTEWQEACKTALKHQNVHEWECTGLQLNDRKPGNVGPERIFATSRAVLPLMKVNLYL